MTRNIDRAGIEETLAALASQPHDDCLSRMTFAEISQIAPISSLINGAILGHTPDADDDEQEVRAEFVREQLKFIALTVKSISDHYSHAPVPGTPSTKLMRSQLDEMSANLLQDLAILGVAYASHRLHCKPASP